MYKMPIRKSFCDSWYQACYNDLFCGAGGGDFFSCAKVCLNIMKISKYQ